MALVQGYAMACHRLALVLLQIHVLPTSLRALLAGFPGRNQYKAMWIKCLAQGHKTWDSVVSKAILPL